MDIFSKKRKGMELPINTIVILIVLLVALAIMLILITRSGSDLVEIGGTKIEGAGGASECQVVCWECCHGVGTRCDSNSPSDPPALFLNPGQNCGCFGDGTGC